MRLCCMCDKAMMWTICHGTIKATVVLLLQAMDMLEGALSGASVVREPGCHKVTIMCTTSHIVTEQPLNGIRMLLVTRKCHNGAKLLEDLECEDRSACVTMYMVVRHAQ